MSMEKYVNGKVRAGNQRAKFVEGPEFVSVAAQQDIDVNIIAKFHSNPLSGFWGDAITRKI